MSDGRPKLCDVSDLADAGSHVQFDLPIADMARLRPALANPEGWVRGSARFDRERGRPVARLRFTAQLHLRCQRCLEALAVRLEGGSQVHFVANEAAAQELPPEAESLLAADGKVLLRDLVEEELMVSLPISPRHENGECGAPSEQPEARQVQRPFAALDELMRSAARRGRGD